MLRRTSLGMIACLAVATTAGAQETGITVTLTVSPSYVAFDGLGSGPAAVARLSVNRDFSRILGGEFSAFALAPLGGATSMPDCVPGGNCQTVSTPSLLSGVLTSMLFYAGETGLRASLGAGGVIASGGEGWPRRSGAAAVAGLDWVPRTTNRFAPTFSFRFVQLASPVSGARQLLLPGVGLRF